MILFTFFIAKLSSLNSLNKRILTWCSAFSNVNSKWKTAVLNPFKNNSDQMANSQFGSLSGNKWCLYSSLFVWKRKQLIHQKGQNVVSINNVQWVNKGDTMKDIEW